MPHLFLHSSQSSNDVTLLPVERLQPHVDVVANESPFVGALGLWKQVGPLVRSANRGRFIKDRLAPVVEMRSGQPKCESQNERERAERTRDQHSNGQQRLRVGLPASPPTETQTGLEGEQCSDDGRNEQ